MSEASDGLNRSMAGGHVLARNVVWNLVGTLVPLGVGAFAVPLLIRGMGTDRFGVLTLAWVAVGYFSLFDLGLGRALTKLVADQIGSGDLSNTPTLIWTSLLIMLILGAVGAGVVAALSPWLVHSVLRIPAGIQPETLSAFFVLSAALPIVITSTGLRGVLEGHQRFRAVGALRALLGVLTFGSPLIVLPFSHSLAPTAVALAISRLVVLLLSLVLCFIYVPEMRGKFRVDLGFLPALFRFGLWMTVSNVVGPLLVYVDRFVIGAMISVSAVAYYATPYEFVTKFLLIPGAMASVLFPAFSTTFTQDPAITTPLFERGTKFAFLAMFPFTLVTVAFASQGLSLWLGPEFAKHSAAVLQWLAVGVFMCGIAQVPFAQVQAAGRPDITAKLHLLELPFYLFTLWFLMTKHGILGAAIAWTARVTVDSVLLFLVAGWLLPRSARGIRKIFLSCLGAVSVLTLGALPSPILIKFIFVTVVCGVFVVAAWFVVLTPSEKAFVWKRARSLPVEN